jgi:hypothetical protein
MIAGRMCAAISRNLRLINRIDLYRILATGVGEHPPQRVPRVFDRLGMQRCAAGRFAYRKPRHELIDGQGVNVGNGDRAKLGQHVAIEQLAVVLGGALLELAQRHASLLGVEPIASPFVKRAVAACALFCRVNGAAMLAGIQLSSTGLGGCLGRVGFLTQSRHSAPLLGSHFHPVNDLIPFDDSPASVRLCVMGSHVRH